MGSCSTRSSRQTVFSSDASEFVKRWRGWARATRDVRYVLSVNEHVNVHRPPAIVPQQHRIHPSARVFWVNRSSCTLLAQAVVPYQHPPSILHLYPRPPPPTHTTSPPPCPHIQSSTASSTPTGLPTGSSTSSTSSCGRARIWAGVKLGCGESFVEALRKDGRN